MTDVVVVTDNFNSLLELLDVDTGSPVAHGQSGDMVCTCLYKKDVFPIIRFNTLDVSAFETGSSALDLPFRRITGFLGRSDNMVKLRGINIFPSGLGAILTENFPELGGEYICEVTRQNNRDTMVVHIETASDLSRSTTDYQTVLKTKTGVEIDVQLVASGELAPLTQIEHHQKPIRLLDKRQDE